MESKPLFCILVQRNKWPFPPQGESKRSSHADALKARASHLFPFWPEARIMQAFPKACPTASVWISGRM